MTYPTPIENPIPKAAIRRLAPNPDGSWPETKSWLGGCPKLGRNSWPLGPKQRPLHHLASISLEEIAPFLNGQFPKEGTLAFFVGEEEVGQVIHATGDIPIEPPSGITSYDFERVFGISERSVLNRLDHYPIIVTDKEVPRHSKKEMWTAWQNIPEEEKPIFWDAAYLLLFDLKRALTKQEIFRGIGRLAEMFSRNVDDTLLRMPVTYTELPTFPKNAMEALQRELDSYRDFVSSFEEKVSANDRWSRMTDADIAWLKEVCSQLVYNSFSSMQRFPGRANSTPFGAILGKSVFMARFQEPMITHILSRPAPALGELPETLLEALDYEPGYAPISGNHHMFGYGDTPAYGDVCSCQHLLQISLHDPVLRDRSEVVYHFVILPRFLEAGNLSAIKCVAWYGS